MPIDFAKLEKDLADAVMAACSAATALDERNRAEAVAEGGTREGALLDRGTCNFDSAMLHLPRFTKATTKAIEDAAAKAGVGGYLSASRWRKGFIFGVPLGAQADRRTVQARAMAESLKAAGWDTSVWYAMD